MPLSILIIPNSINVGLSSITSGLARALENYGIKTGLFQPMINPSNNWENELEAIIAAHQELIPQYDILIIQGMILTQETSFAHRFNLALSKALDAKIIIAATPRNYSESELLSQIKITQKPYDEILGVVLNKLGGPVDNQGNTRLDLADRNMISPEEIISITEKTKNYFKINKINLIASIPWELNLLAPRVIDIANLLQAKPLYPGEYETRRVQHLTLCARSLNNMLFALKPGVMIITSGDRTDIILATCMAALSGIKISALLLTGDYPIPDNILKLCEEAIQTGLPILSTQLDSFRTVVALQNLNTQIPIDDVERNELSKNNIAQYFDKDWIEKLISKKFTSHLSPAAFKYKLINQARLANKKIILPEGVEPRTIQAAIECQNKNIAQCVLLGDKKEISKIAKNNGLDLPKDLTIVNPDKIRKKYIKPMVELRKHKQLTDIQAKEQLHDNVVLATMMLQMGDVDGLVSGAIHTTANTIRPALQLIKTADTASIVSSIFFMCLPNQVLVYGDCAVNPDPNPEQLADIAIQSHDSALAFGIEPRVAMISYSTGQSGMGADVDKVKKATKLVREKREDIIIDGPLQYDAAIIESVGKQKAPGSPVAGQATVIIFPDLNTGNTTYKAVQRSADVLSIGPMLQGLKKPVNDLSRGALIDDIVYTIAITAIQANS